VTDWTRTLVAVDWDGDANLDRLLDRIGDALIDVTTVVEARPVRTNDVVDKTVHYVRFDGSKVRDTHVHGYGYHAGFLVHLA
jgi:hypothetical protein